MKNIMKISIAFAVLSLAMTGCIEEVEPQSGTVTGPQVERAPGGLDNLVSAITSTMVGQFEFGVADAYPWDYGYPSFYLMRDVMGQDIAIEPNDWYSTWYQVGVYLGPMYMYCQIPWTYYYKWINNCNVVLKLAGSEPKPNQFESVGIAHAMRAMYYMDMARMFQYTYKGHEQDITVPIVTENSTLAELVNNPRATNEVMWAFIIEDLDMAETFLEGIHTDVYTPDISVVYGLKARAYLTIEDFPNAVKYARMAQAGYTPMNEEQYTDRMTAFNTPNGSWMFAVKFSDSDANITANDSDSNWGSQMFLEVKGGLYASAYGQPKRIDAHLYSTIPLTDWRRKCYIDPALDGMDNDERIEALAAYTDYPELITQAASASTSKRFGGLSLKFRAGGGVEGRTNPYLATVVSVPLMRVEEMILIEAEAAGMQSEGEGITILTNFAKTRDPDYEYDSQKSFRDNVWMQRRVELWGEGFATFDIKRLNKGIIRSYPGTNHPTGYRYNTTDVPYWMNLCIVQTEANYNEGIINNPTPTKPNGDSPEHIF